MVTSDQKNKAFMKHFFFLTLLVFPTLGFAQDSIDAINEIKLSGKYFTAEATATNEGEAKKLAFMGLMEKLFGYCEEMEITEIEENKVKAVLQTKSIKRGDNILMMVYVTKDIVDGKKPTIVFTPNNNAVTTIPHVSSATVSLNMPNIIKQIENIDTYASLQYLLDKAKDNGEVEDWGKYRTVTNPDDCYLIMINTDRQIVGVLSPNKNGVRTNMKTGKTMDSENMKTFINCAPICILIK